VRRGDVMPDVIAQIAEKSIIAGGFFYLLYYLIKNMGLISTNLTKFGESLNEVCTTLLKIDMRMEQIEARITRLEERERVI